MLGAVLSTACLTLLLLLQRCRHALPLHLSCPSLPLMCPALLLPCRALLTVLLPLLPCCRPEPPTARPPQALLTVDLHPLGCRRWCLGPRRLTYLLMAAPRRV